MIVKTSEFLQEKLDDASVGGHYRMHLLAASGYYQHLLLRIQMECGVAFNNVLDFGFISEARTEGTAFS